MSKRQSKRLNCLMRMRRRNRIIIGLLIAFVVLVGSSAVIPLLDQDAYSYEWLEIIFYALPYLVCLIVSIAIRHFSKMLIPNVLPKMSKFNPFLVVSGVVLMYATQIIVSPLAEFIPETYVDYMDDYVNFLESGFYPMFIVLIVAPILQEWTFRGIFQKNISRVLGAGWGIFLSGFAFALTYIAPHDVVYMLGAGVAIAAIYFVAESLSTVIWIHMLFNGINYLSYLMFDNVVSWSELFEGFLAGYVIVWTISTILVIVTVWWVLHHFDKRTLLRKITKK